MKFENFVILEKPMSESKMKETTKQGFAFRLTLFSISEECKKDIINEVKKNHM